LFLCETGFKINWSSLIGLEDVGLDESWSALIGLIALLLFNEKIGIEYHFPDQSEYQCILRIHSFHFLHQPFNIIFKFLIKTIILILKVNMWRWSSLKIEFLGWMQ